MRETQTEVLVVGAGPVGLWTALLLAERGIEVSLIDRESRTAARSYACALHPSTLKLLDSMGLAESALERGHRVETLAFYDGAARQAEIQFARLGGAFPFLLILPQNALERLLEERLRAAGVAVHWHHRFEELAQEETGVSAAVEELEGTSTGYIVPHWETVVKDRAHFRAEFLIGADGHNSMVRPRAGLEYRRAGATESFAVFEFESGSAMTNEVRVVLDDTTTNVLWPLAEKRCRWTFQLERADLSGDFPEKERRAVRFEEPVIDERLRQYVHKVAQQRAPWFNQEVKKVLWCSEVSFERRLVEHFGRSRCWLLGDAAHQTGPVGVHSMNRGFAEAASLSLILHNIIRQGGALELLNSYAQAQQTSWQMLLDTTALKPRPGASPWVAKRCDRILPCLPASGDDLLKLASQLALEPG